VLSHIATNKLPIVSIDIPSGWDVNNGRQALEDTDGVKVETFQPDVLPSLTAPKRGVEAYRGRHFLGGRFIPSHVQSKYHLKLEYPGAEQIAEL
jgi:NAD(P)H-hydrate epimerase